MDGLLLSFPVRMRRAGFSVSSAMGRFGILQAMEGTRQIKGKGEAKVSEEDETRICLQTQFWVMPFDGDFFKSPCAGG